ncbi:MAG: aldehyde ferredoxin oxidoreductase family protein [Proteobacteria bacterium]|nr:aldehyde ferredoxin oxidoreductase family protein [Pseudomonadota bacterium]MBU1583317.1 aldehyde ferredoxin oxidoreductase family protein [Pseudomonadota bacterium]MBU2452151.1 aldehyde ferredoxin oxidoreductase family protein [Pseudomonadota bacterium]MBU2629576.1 aldehyde ferredoxin oxidoreductase family protein [Pseudomonadota bacterium]
MKTKRFGYYGVLLNIHLTTGRIDKSRLSFEDIDTYIGGRGLGMKLLWDNLEKPGIDPLSPQNPLIFMPGPFSGFPIPCASRTCVISKSPCTSPLLSDHAHASTISYSNFGGFFGPEIKFAGYDGIIITGKAPAPVYILIDNDRVDIKDAAHYWGMGTDEFDKKFSTALGSNRYRTCYIGPAGENLVPYASIMHTAARAAGRGVGCIMGSKNLKAIAIKGSHLPETADHQMLLERMNNSRNYFKGLSRGKILSYLFRSKGTAFLLEKKSKQGVMTVKNFQEGTFSEIDQISCDVARERLWVRDYACYCCPLACKKSGIVKNGLHKGLLVHDGPEYETGTMLGANLMISDLESIMKLIYDGDNFGLDIISAGNVIGFLMEAYDKGIIDKNFLDGIDLTWGNAQAAIKILEKIAKKEGIGVLAAKGVKALSKHIDSQSADFAMHVKGLELAAHNVQANPPKGLCYATANRGACHQNGETIEEQDFRALIDALGICRFACTPPLGLSLKKLAGLLESITGVQRTPEDLLLAGERIFNLEKMFNYTEGFNRQDDNLPERFFKDPLSFGPKKGAVLDRKEFETLLSKYYQARGWDPETSKPQEPKLAQLGLLFTKTR